MAKANFMGESKRDTVRQTRSEAIRVAGVLHRLGAASHRV